MTFADQTRYVVVQKTGTDMLHINPREECNTDDADNLQTIDRLTARAMAERAMHNAEVEIEFCKHCTTLQMIGALTQPLARTVDTAEVVGIGLASDGEQSHIPYLVTEDPDAEAILIERGTEYRVPVVDPEG